VNTQLDAFCSVWQDVDLRYARKKNLTDYDVLKIASLIQGEAVVDSDRPKIAAVIYNRLHLRMPLGIDAALRYALHIPGTESIRESQLANQTPYNLRVHLGLPPTPINNPGRVDRGGRAPCACRLPVLRGEARQAPSLLHGERSAFQHYLCQHGYGC
jgi:Predicted periplasmic solute-binding protein